MSLLCKYLHKFAVSGRLANRALPSDSQDEYPKMDMLVQDFGMPQCKEGDAGASQSS